MKRFSIGIASALICAAAAQAGPKEDCAKSWDKGAQALVSKQNADGGWGIPEFGKDSDVGISSMVVAALAGSEAGSKKYADQIAKACDYILKNQESSGAIHNAKAVPKLTNYKTSIAVMALAAVDKAKFKDPIAKAVAWLTHHQYSDNAEGEYKVDPKDPNNGGSGYEEDKGEEGPKADMSNTSYMLEALKAAEVPKDSEVWKRAVKYIEHCQNRSESNDGPGFDKLGLTVGDDGGFFYRPGEGKANTETLPNGKKILRSYGSMTYSGYKSLLYAGLSKDDPRVKAAMGWITKNYTLDENPGMKQEGVYYYYQAFANAMDASGLEEIKDAGGDTHKWAEELAAKLAKLQAADGTWVGTQRWYEDTPTVPTLYALLALNKAAKHLK